LPCNHPASVIADQTGAKLQQYPLAFTQSVRSWRNTTASNRLNQHPTRARSGSSCVFIPTSTSFAHPYLMPSKTIPWHEAAMFVQAAESCNFIKSAQVKQPQNRIRANTQGTATGPKRPAQLATDQTIPGPDMSSKHHHSRSKRRQRTRRSSGALNQTSQGLLCRSTGRLPCVNQQASAKGMQWGCQ